MAEAAAYNELAIRERLAPGSVARVDHIQIFDVVDSTNTHLMSMPGPPVGRATVAVADYQTRGRGRHDRRWETVAGSSLCVSLAYTFVNTEAVSPSLTLAMGVAVAKALSRLGIVGVQLKWPNDIVFEDAKLGGLLTESRVRDGVTTIVVGVGINVDLGDDMILTSASKWASRATDLKAATGDVVNRQTLLIAIVDEVLLALRDFERGESDLVEWRKRDWLRGKVVAVDSGVKLTEGIASGVDDDGALLIETASGPERVVAGSVSVEMDHDSTAV